MCIAQPGRGMGRGIRKYVDAYICVFVLLLSFNLIFIAHIVTLFPCQFSVPLANPPPLSLPPLIESCKKILLQIEMEKQFLPPLWLPEFDCGLTDLHLFPLYLLRLRGGGGRYTQRTKERNVC